MLREENYYKSLNRCQIIENEYRCTGQALVVMTGEYAISPDDVSVCGTHFMQIVATKELRIKPVTKVEI